MPSTCRSKLALVKGLRPLLANQQQVAATQKILASACSTGCIYCDIWKLATLINSHVPLSARYNLHTSTPSSSPTSSRPSSPILSSPMSRSVSNSSASYSPIVSASKKIEAQFQQQRSQLSSILSICIVSGAEATEGLRIAHDRCSAAVEDLLDQEEDLEEELLRDLEEQRHAYEYDYGYSSSYNYHHQERRPSVIHVAI